MAARYAYHLLTMTGGCCRSNLAIYIQTRPNNRRIAHPAVHLKGHARGGACPRKPTRRIQGNHANGIVVLDVHLGLVFRLLQPLLPLGFRLRREEIFLLKSATQGELQSAITHQHYVGCVLHYRPGHRSRVLDKFQCGHRANAEILIHHAGIQGNTTISVGPAAIAHRAFAGVGLHQLYPGLNGIQSIAAFRKQLPGFGIGLQAKIPGGEHNRPALPL